MLLFIASGIIPYNITIHNTLLTKGISIFSCSDFLPLTPSITITEDPAVLESHTIDAVKANIFLPKSPYIIAKGRADLNGDGIDDFVYAQDTKIRVLYGNKEQTLIFGLKKGFNVILPDSILVNSLYR
ncbi:MAG: VCBS repeat-containing protein [Candidatus Midichloria mitochondrii]|uniref:FG-GAP repeat domain-containing protein n=1 Tax=Candidatus Midichloria mitochondrii TaxID=234827 RepID=UPI00059CA5BE|nr:VCBS repeat-containing protein [Candidatus Midichloria mitochondrii]MDJ1256849.1 VCBS repeat-containing protein [Candidatus Midichloria mitochondrii]MDJ1288585.1 VCBS repeat-containing protein [Candidatus Midichloria mitochondrii]MDJ1299392.1 VCBS repeat-containing protein [Candidatus Midichloria mitochondrii]MDJ1313531.1 VCBS repeat-containing protein [Candidatus Midichloria mitochondrii]MDJ1584090.1 VCBS repeat-containing protein [Candidatus Midichloria mitochondrii]